MTDCRVCSQGKGQALRVFATEQNERLNLARCSACRSEFLDPQPSDAWLGREYAGYYQKRSTELKRPRSAMFDALLEQVPLDWNGKHVLEIGAGEGDCAAALLERSPNVRVVAVEANPEAKTHFAPLVATQRCEFVSVPVETWLAARPADAPRFDALLLFDVLEHLRDPVATLKFLATQALAPGGTLIATFPNAESLSRSLLGRVWPQYKVEHLFYFSAEGVRALGRQAGLETLNLTPLTKRLPWDYLFAVGENFGPTPLKRSVALARRCIPESLGRQAWAWRYGEWLWVARRS